MGGEGIEPSRPFSHRILSPACIPFHHPPESSRTLGLSSSSHPGDHRKPGLEDSRHTCEPRRFRQRRFAFFRMARQSRKFCQTSISFSGDDELFIPYGKSLSHGGRKWRRGPDLNRCIAVLQTAALPLGYRAIINFYFKRATAVFTISSTSAKAPLPISPQASLPSLGSTNFTPSFFSLAIFS
jgi:hypothetical protein